MLERLASALSRALEMTIVTCLAVMSVLVFGNVVLRYGFDSGIVWSEELSRLVFVWLIFLGAILAAKDHAHIAFDTLLARLPLRWRKLCVALSGLAMLAGCACFIVGGWQQTIINLDNQYPVLGISYGWLYGVAVVFGAGMGVTIMLELWNALLRAPQEARP